MLKQVYRIIILIAVFVASIYYFSRDIKEVVFDINNLTKMEEATFPLVTIKSGEYKINLLHGYSSNLEANAIREAVTPLGKDHSFEVVINQEQYDIKKLNYELRDFVTNDLIETDSVSVFEDNGSEKSAKIKLTSELDQRKEYAVKLTLVTSESRKIYYYHRVKFYDEAYVNEKLDFIMDFHNAIKNKVKAEDYAKYLEPKGEADNTTLAKVNIYSSFELVTWGNLKPEFMTEVIPTIVEIYQDTASVVLKYIVRVEISGNVELQEVKEYYRVRYTKDRMYLLNYERSMEALFDASLTSIAKSELKLGISSETELPYLVSPDKQKLAFVRSRELWFYNLEENEMVRVFSFRQENTDYIRDLYDQHDIRILNMDAEGNINFLVYGYMNRGQYEGRVAVILYEYIRAENRIEEKVYIPVEEPYQTLNGNLGEFAYYNSLDVFYFHMQRNIYAYNLITGKLSELAHQIDQDKTVFIREQNIVAWQDSSDPGLAGEIRIMELETGDVQSIKTLAGYSILLMDMIDTNLVYGFAAKEDIITLVDGRVIAPMSMIEIASADKQVLKNYRKAGYYVTDLEVLNNTIELTRVQRADENGRKYFAPAAEDYIMNQGKDTKPLLEVTSRVTENALAEWYLSLPGGFIMERIPDIKVTVNTVISQDPTLRLPEKDMVESYFQTYAAGEITGRFMEAEEAIEAANEGTGVVLDHNHRLVWERGVKVSKKVISGFDDPDILSEDSLESCIGLLLKHLGKNVSSGQVTMNGRSAYEVMDSNMEERPVRLTGATLDDVLYYVSEGRPVIAMTSQTDAVLIYGYDNFNINVVDPKQNKTDKIGLQDSEEMFEEAGNVFLSYLEQ